MSALANIISNIQNCLTTASADLNNLSDNNNKIPTSDLSPSQTVPYKSEGTNIIKATESLSYGGKTGRKHRRGKKTRRNNRKTARRNR